MRVGFAFLALGGLSTALVASGRVSSPAVPIDSLLAQARTEAARAEANERRLEAAAAEARSDADRLVLRRQAAAQAIEAAEAQISAADARSAIINAHLADERLRLAKEQAPAQSLLAGLYLMGERPPLLLLADSRSAEQLVTMQLVLRAVLPSIRAHSEALARDLQRTEHLRRAQASARKLARLAREQLQRRASDLEQLETEATLLAQSRGAEAISAGDVAIAQKEEANELQAQALSQRSAAALAAELASLGPAPQRPFTSEVPAPAVLSYRLPTNAPVVEGVGAVSDSGIRSRSITFDTRRGARIFAPASGTILFSGPFRTFDGVVIIDHGGGWKSVLINVGANLPRGTRVEAGRPIGIAMRPIEVQLLRGGIPVSAALIAGSSAMLSNEPKGG